MSCFPLTNQSSGGGHHGLQVSLSVSQSQSQTQYTSHSRDSLQRLLLKLWIKKRLEQLRDNTTTVTTVVSLPPSSTLAPQTPSTTPAPQTPSSTRLPTNPLDLTTATTTTTVSPCPAVYQVGTTFNKHFDHFWPFIPTLMTPRGTRRRYCCAPSGQSCSASSPLLAPPPSS